MKILHISNDFFGSKVHSNLYKSLDELGLKQTVFTYCREPSFIGKNQFESDNTDFIYKCVLSLTDRIFYRKKVEKLYRHLLQSINPHTYDCSHATTLFSDGALSYRLYRNYGLPYVVAVRSTDVDFFLRFIPRSWPVAKKVLLSAEKIVFISSVLQEKLYSKKQLASLLPLLKEKTIVQPNGIDSFWLQSVNSKSKETNNSHKIVFAGTFVKRKHIDKLEKAVIQLIPQFPNIELHLIGGTGGMEKKVLSLAASHSEHIIFHGWVKDREKLRRLYSGCSVFAMPSDRETFGLVYVEALTQGLALLYVKRQGVDGLFKENIGEAIEHFSVKEIKKALTKLLSGSEKYYTGNELQYGIFDWKFIAAKYMTVYEQITGN